MTAIFAVATAALFGIADFAGGFATRRESPFAVTAVSHLLGGTLLAFVLLATGRGGAGGADVVFGVLAGVSGGLGVAALYAGLAAGRMGVVAPIAAALSGSLPAVFDFATGQRLSAVGLAGVLLAVVAVVIVSLAERVDPEDGDSGSMAPIVLAVAAGVGFAGAYIAFSYTSEASGLWPVLASRVASVSLIGTLAFVPRRRVAIARPVLPWALAAGVADTLANVSMLTAVRLGPLAVASVLSSLYPVVTILLARLVLGERLRRLQRLGIAVALVAVVLTAAR